MITVENLIHIIDQNDYTSNKFKVANLLLNAISDWPQGDDSVEEYIHQLKTKLKIHSINKENLEMSLGKMSVPKNAWEMESIAGVLEIFKITGERELGEALKQLEGN